jgi:hypothetical protein
MPTRGTRPGSTRTGSPGGACGRFAARITSRSAVSRRFIAATKTALAGPDQERVRRHVPDLLLVDRDGGVTVVDVKSR